MNEFEAHESSYDHQHKKRLKEMKQMQRDPLASSKARKAERKADEKSGLITIKPVKLEAPSTTTTTSGFKKGGFKSAFGSGGGGEEEEKKKGGGGDDAGLKLGGGKKAANDGNGEDVRVKEELVEESDTDSEYDYYDPRRPTDCFAGCPGL
ncbi:hypothetical protein MMC20_004894 [Loxospora ochrophaea]|nr:hypothetical protein [Loxospora ochrophaea]